MSNKINWIRIAITVLVIAAIGGVVLFYESNYGLIYNLRGPKNYDECNYKVHNGLSDLIVGTQCKWNDKIFQKQP